MPASPYAWTPSLPLSRSLHICVRSSECAQAPASTLLRSVPASVASMDEAEESLTVGGDLHRSCSHPVGTHRRKRAVTSATHHAQPSGKAPVLVQAGSSAPGRARAGCTLLETGALHCQAR